MVRLITVYAQFFSVLSIVKFNLKVQILTDYHFSKQKN